MLSVNSGFEGEVSLVDAGRIIFSPYGDLAMVCLSSASGVSMINTSTGRVVMNIGVRGRTVDAIFSQDSLFFYMVNENGMVQQYYAHIWGPRSNRTITPAPREIVLSKNGPRPYMISDDALYEFDFFRNSIVRSIAVDGVKAGLAVSADSRYIYTISDSLFNIVSLSGWELRSVAIAEGASLMVLDSIGMLAYVCNERLKGVQVLDVASERVVGLISVGGNVVDIALASNGTRAFFLVAEGAEMWVVDTVNDFKVIDRVLIGHEVSNVAVTPDGSRVYVSNGSTVKVFRTDRWSA